MLCLKQPVTAAKAEAGADSCGLQMSKQILPSDNKNKLITFVATSGLISGKQDKKKRKRNREREREREEGGQLEERMWWLTIFSE